MNKLTLPLLTTLWLAALPGSAAERTLNNGNLILQGIPEIPADIKADLRRYQNVRSAGFRDWSANGRDILVTTRFGNVSQLHRVSSPGGQRYQLTFNDEPMGNINRQPGSNQIAYTMDSGGSEFAQLFVMEPGTGDAQMLTDGESRNGAVLWNRDGSEVAFYSTQADGRSYDIWTMDVEEPESQRMVFKASGGAYHAPTDFSADAKSMLFYRYTSIVNSEAFLLDLETGEETRLAGGGENPTANYPVGFDADESGFFFLTDRGGEFVQLAYASLENPDDAKIITASIDWNVEAVELSPDRRRAVFVVNAGGLFQLYLLDTQTHQYRRVENLPIGVIGNMGFSPDGNRLAMTLNTPKTPSDTFVLSLGEKALDAGKLTRWTFSEVGGLNTDKFIEPTLISYKTFDERMIPAFYYEPEAEGPHPVIISIHGGPEGQALPTFSSTYQMWLAKLGAAVLVPNVRGSDGYGRSYLQLDNGFLREDSVKDIGALLDWVATQPQLDASRVAVIGGSYGGYMVLASSVFYSDRLQAAVDIVGISSFVTFLQNTQDYRRDLRRAEYGDERDPAMRAHLEKISPLNNVENIRVPMLVVQGNNDPRVPVTEAEQIVAALRAQNQPVWYMNALNEGHGYRKKENRDIYREAVVLFFREYLLK